MRFHDLPDKSQSPALSAQRTFADSGKIGIFIEAVFLENGHHARVFHPPVLNDGLINKLARIVHIGIGRYVYFLQHFGHGKHGAGVEKPRKMVSRKVIIQRIVGNLTDIQLQLFQVFNPENLFLRFRRHNNKIAESQVFFHRPVKIQRKGFRILIDKPGIYFGGVFPVFGLRRSVYNGYVFIFAPYPFSQLFTRRFVFLSVLVKTHIREYAQHIVAVFLVKAHGFFVVAGKQNFGTPAHTHHTQVVVERFFRELFRLVKHIFIEQRQRRRIKTDGVFHQHNRLYANRPHIVFHVHFVLDQLDDGKQQIGISQPAKNIVHARNILFLKHPRNRFRKRREQHDGDIRKFVLDDFRLGKNFVVVHIGHAND